MGIHKSESNEDFGFEQERLCRSFFKAYKSFILPALCGYN